VGGVIDRDLCDIPSPDIPKIRVEQTWLVGERVYSSRNDVKDALSQR